MTKPFHFRILFTCIFFVLMGCSSSRVYKLMGGCEISESNYKIKIPFEMRKGLIIVKVTIEGNNYDFLLDTGAPNVVSKELAEELNLKSVGKLYTRGSQGERHKIDYANIRTIQVGGLNYQNTTAAIMDLRRSVVLDCIQLDGILGANVMRNSIWQIDYKKRELTITNSTDSLKFTNNLDTIPFTTKQTGTPMINIQIGNTIQKGVTLDTGSGGHIDLNSTTFKNTRKNQPNLPFITGFGQSSSGVYGMGKPDTLYFFKPDSIIIGSVELGAQICTASVRKTSSTLGTRFLENYIATFDWSRNQLVLDSVSQYNNTELISFGYKMKFENDSLKVGFLFSNTSVVSSQIELNSHITKIDSSDYTKIKKSDYCKLILDTTQKNIESQTIQFTSDRLVKTIRLKKEIILK